MDLRSFSIAILALVVAVTAQAGSDLNSQVFGYEDWMRSVEELGLDPAEVVYPFHVDDEMQSWVRDRMDRFHSASPEVQLKALQQSFFDRGEFVFDYEQARTLTAEEAFAVRHGNCMSFTSLFIALSRSVGLPTFLVAVERDPAIEKDDNLVVVNRHVVAGYRAPDKIHLFDFYVAAVEPAIERNVVDDLGASALYHTNIGGREIRRGNYHEAVRHLEIATVIEPDWAPAWVNLGVSRMRTGDEAGAMEAYRQALIAEPGNSSALVNMAGVYRSQGLEEEARTAMLAAAEGSRNPFTLIAMADMEMLRGDFEEARQYLRRARWWYSKEPEVYEALSRLAIFTGDEEKARKYASKAAALRARSDRGEEAGPG
jgi:Flp pilus assembly protein TadD